MLAFTILTTIVLAAFIIWITLEAVWALRLNHFIDVLLIYLFLMFPLILSLVNIWLLYILI